MKKYLALSVVASTLLMAGGDVKPVEPVVEAVAEQSMGTVSGQLRAFYIDRTYDAGTTLNRNALSAGGWVKYESPEFHGLSAAVALYGVNGFDIHSMDLEDDVTNSYSSYDPSLSGRNGESYGFIGEAYLNYKRGSSNLKIGRQKLNTPMAGADDARMLPNLFEAAVYSNTGIENTTLIAAHVTKETTGTFSNIYDKSASLGMYSGYGLGTPLAQSGTFKNMGVVALDAGNNTDGVTAGAVIYKGIEGVTLQLWDYYAHDILNVIYAQGDYGWNCILNPNVKMSASVQYIKESDIGDKLAAQALGHSIDTDFWGVKLGASSGALSGYAAYSKSGDDGILSPWGGMPAFTQGMVTRHQFFADTDAWKVAGTYKVNADLKVSAYYTSFDIPANNLYGLAQTTAFSGAWTAKESGFDIQYQATKDLNLRFRGNFPTKFTPTVGWDEYRVIANYNF